MELMKLERRTVLHVVDKYKKFNTAIFTHEESLQDVWNASMSMWVRKHVGFPDKFLDYQGRQFQSNEWKDMLQMAGMTDQSSCVESHNVLGVGKRYHSFLRCVFNKTKLDNHTPTS